MSASLMSGKEVALLKKKQLKHLVIQYTQDRHRAPGLAVILVGCDPASLIYVTNKRLACKEVGIVSFFYELPKETSEQDLLNLIFKLNNSKKIDGILIQLPLPEHINTPVVIEHINPKKDV